MPEINQHSVTHKELATILVRELGIREGLWGVYVEFRLGAANVGASSETDLLPAAIVPVVKIGIQRFEKENNLTVNAADLKLSKSSRKLKTKPPKIEG